MTPGVHRRAALAVAVHCPGTLAERRQVLETLGLVAPGGRVVLTVLGRPDTPPRPRPVPVRHGTVAGYRIHWRRREPACPACLAARRVYEAGLRRTAGIPARTCHPIKHGTASGYRTHLRREPPPCAACTAAERDYRKQRRATLRKAA